MPGERTITVAQAANEVGDDIAAELRDTFGWAMITFDPRDGSAEIRSNFYDIAQLREILIKAADRLTDG